ncbi:MAG: TolC family protein [Candidatus Omnitrophica bacterium]|nr:TolC family protein [Candidatus Omnitrophota bacterium]
MKKIIIFSIAVFFILFSVLALRAEEISLSLDEVVSIALRDNPDVRLKVEDVKKAKAKINEARSALFPSLNLGAGWSDTRGLYSKDVSGFSGQAGVSQVIYAGGRVINTIKAGEDNYLATQAVLDKAKLDTVASVKQAYYTILLAEKLAGINKAIVENTREHQEFIQARYLAGQVSESESIKMRSALAGVVQAYEAALNQLESSRALLNNLLFLDNQIQIDLSGDFSYSPLEVVYDEAFLKALRSRPEIRQLEAQKNAAGKNVEIAKSGNRPQVAAAWDYYSNSRQPSTAARNQNDYNVLGVSVSWPVFDGRLTRSKVEQAIIDLKEMQLLKEKAVRDIVLELKTAYLALKDAIEKTRSVAEEVAVYKDNLSVIEEKHKSGIVSGLDLHDAQLSCSVALFGQAQADYDYLIAKARFERAVGGK